MRGICCGFVAACIAGLFAAASAGATQLRLTSPAFAYGKPIPRKYTCDGAGLSPPLRWSGAPSSTKSFAIIVEDPGATAGSWTHWVLYDLAASSTTVPQGVPPLAQLPNGARQGRNDARGVGYSGPCPAPGRAHTYWFRVYALDAPTGLPAEASRPEVFRAMRRHVLAVAEVMGTYSRRDRHAGAMAPRHPRVAACHEIDAALPALDGRPPQGPGEASAARARFLPHSMRWLPAFSIRDGTSLDPSSDRPADGVVRRVRAAAAGRRSPAAS